MMSGKIIAGIDPGVKTGLAIWDCGSQKFINIQTLPIVQAMHELDIRTHLLREIWFEDARLRTWFGNADREKLQGAGSIKRDCSVWQEFCEYYGIPFKPIKPASGQTKWSAEYFKRVTGWKGRTSQHARDAAVLVFGVKR
ncbi:MAG: hypothetical protein RTU92_02605 [Candidatus Thorarchaeota archaeon]